MLIPERFRAGHRSARGRFHEDPRRVAFPLDAGLAGVHADGSEFPVQISLSPLESADGMHVVAAIRDMTEWQAAQKALRDSEGRYRSLLDDVLDTSSIGVCILDAELSIVWVNRAFESYLGQERSDLVGRSAREVVSRRVGPVVEDSESFLDKVLATYDDNTYTEHFECHVVAEGGRLDPLAGILEPADRLRRLRRRPHRAVRRGHRTPQRRAAHPWQFVDIARNMRIGLLVYHLEDLDDDRTLRLRIANPEAERILGVTEADIAGRLIDEAFPMLRDDGVPAIFAGALRSGEAQEVHEYGYGDDRVAFGDWSFRAFPLPEQCVGVLFERRAPSEPESGTPWRGRIT